MNEERKKRYKEKIEYARDRISDLEEWLSEYKWEKKTFFASEKAFQELVEALSDVFAMILSDSNYGVGDDYSNIEKLKDKKILKEEHVGILNEANGLRNRLVHKYNHVDESIFMESTKNLLKKIDGVINHIEGYLENESVKSAEK